MSITTRIEHDSLGEKAVPADRYYGVQTLRARENFNFSRMQLSDCPEMIRALAYVKKAAALANQGLSILPADISCAICAACDELLAGKLHDQFIVDVYQGGAGTSTNMNANEVIANRALELLGKQKGEYQFCHPNDHVNRSQSTNDVYPTAFRLALHNVLQQLTVRMVSLQQAFALKGLEFADVVKMGRTQLQDAVPMTLGQEFSAYATTIGEDIDRIHEAQILLCEINLGATAIGTGLNAPPDYTQLVTEELLCLTGIPLMTSANLVEATWDTGAYVQVSGILKRFAIKLSKISSDLRLLSSGPRTGFGEINLPKMQPGSSIMPGKVNPVIPEVVNQIAYQVIGADLTVTMASENGQLELNVMEPVIAHNMFLSVDLLGKACTTLAEKCIEGISANRQHCRKQVENSIGIVTALNPLIGYENSAAIAEEALVAKRSVYELVLEKRLLSKEQLDAMLAPESMLHPARAGA